MLTGAATESSVNTQMQHDNWQVKSSDVGSGAQRWRVKPAQLVGSGDRRSTR